MTSKTIAFKQPTTSPPPAAEEWVKPSSADTREVPLARRITPPHVVTKRLTVELPEELHTRIKLECVRRRRQAYDLIREMLEAAVAKLEQERL